MTNSPGLFFKKGATLTPASVAGLIGWWESDSGITKSYDTGYNTGRTMTGSTGTSTIVSLGDCSQILFTGSLFQLNSTDNYVVSSISTSLGVSTITTTTTLTTNYSAATLGVESVSQWLDQTSNAYTGIQSTAANKLVYLPSGSNSKPCLIGINTATLLNLSSALYSVPASASTIFIVSKTYNQDVDSTALRIRDSGTGDSLTLGYSSTGTGTIDYFNGNSIIETANITQNSFGILRGRRTGTTQAVSYNNSTEVTNTSATNVTGDSAVLGRVLGQIQVCLIYNVSLTVPNITIVQNYLKAKYSTP